MKHYAALSAAAAALFWAAPSHAVLQFSALVGGVPIACADGQACDLNAAPNVLQTGPIAVGGITFLGSSQTQTESSINTTSFQIDNNTGAPVDVQLAVGGIDFVGPVSLLSQSGSGTFQNAIGSDIQLTFYADQANTQGADTPTDFPGIQTADSGVITATLVTDSFDFNSTFPFADANLYSMTLGTTGTLVDGGTLIGGGSLVGRSQTQVAITAVPEPSTLGLIGSMLIGMGWMIRRRRNRA